MTWHTNLGVNVIPFEYTHCVGNRCLVLELVREGYPIILLGWLGVNLIKIRDDKELRS